MPARAPIVAALAATGALAVVLAGCFSPAEPRVSIDTPGGPVEVTVELALTSEDRSRGLMWRHEMARDHGMLFVFPAERDRSFWMKNTPLALDIIYIDRRGRIVSIAESTTPYSTESIPSDGPAMYVLEVNAGFSRSHGIRAGATVELPALPAGNRPTHR